MISAVTFDFWNTLMWEEPGSLRSSGSSSGPRRWPRIDPEGSSGPRRGAPGVRRLVDRGPAVPRRGRGRADRRRSASPTGPPTEALVEGFSEGGRRAAVHPSDGVRECLEALEQAGMRLGIICDIGLTPVAGRRASCSTRRICSRYFDGMSFSDEVGPLQAGARRSSSTRSRALGGVRARAGRARRRPPAHRRRRRARDRDDRRPLQRRLRRPGRGCPRPTS